MSVDPNLSARVSAEAPAFNRDWSRRRPSFGLLQRLLVLATLFAAEVLLFSIWLDNASLISRGGMMGFVGHWGAWTVRGIVGFAVIFVTFASLKNGPALAEISRQAEPSPLSRGFLAAHLLAMAAFAALSWALYGNHLTAFYTPLFGPLWLVTGLSGIAFAAFSLIPITLWLRLLRETGAVRGGALT